MAEPVQIFLDTIKKQGELMSLIVTAINGLDAQQKLTLADLVKARADNAALVQSNAVLEARATKSEADLADLNTRFVAAAQDVQRLLAAQETLSGNTAEMQKLIDGLRGAQPA